MLPIALVMQALDSGQMLFGSDIVLCFYHLREAVGESLAGGSPPTWDAGLFCGFPMLAGLQSAAFYPLTWLFALLPAGMAWTWTVAIHMMLAGGFAYMWVRRGLDIGRWGALLAAVIYMLSGYFLTHTYAGHITLISAYPWLPAVLWRLERVLAGPNAKRAALLALVIAMLIFAGYPMFVFFAGLLCISRLVHCFVTAGQGWRREWRSQVTAAAGAALGFLLAAPQLLPTLELVAHTQRASGSPFGFVSSQSMPPENFVTFLAPTFFGDVQGTPYWGRWIMWEVCGFVGIVSLVLAFVGLLGKGRQRKLWAGVFVTALLLALGRYAPFFRIFYALVPGAGLFRAPGRYLLLATIAVLPLAAMGLERFIAEKGDTRLLSLRVGASALAACALLALVLAFGHERNEGDSVLWQQVLAASRDLPESSARDQRLDSDLRTKTYRQACRSFAWAALTLAVIGGCLLLHWRGVLDGWWCALALGAVAFVEVVAFGSRYLTGYDEKRMAWPPGLTRLLQEKEKTGPFRIASVDRPGSSEDTRDAGRCQAEGLEHVGGFDPLLLGRYAELMNSIGGRPPDEYLVVANPARPHPVLDMLGVRFRLVREGGPVPTEHKRVARFGDIIVYETRKACSRAFLVPEAMVIEDRGERLRHLSSRGFDPGKAVVLEKRTPAVMAKADGEATVRIVSAAPGSYELDVEGKGGFLVLAEAWYPGWKATIDGETVEILRANHLVQAITLPPGKHAVKFAYSSRFLPIGFLLCLFAAGMLAGYALWERREARAR
ncbi:MAG: YfhO family protein [Planctomycetota bacterium]